MDDAPGRRAEQRAPIQLLSIELVRQLARELSSTGGLPRGTFLSHFPTGWYRTSYDVRVEDSEDIETTQPMILVFDADKKGFAELVSSLAKAFPTGQLDAFRSDELKFDSVEGHLRAWALKYLGLTEPDETRLVGIFSIARHIAQTGVAPAFFPFEARGDHDLDAVARHCIQNNLGPLHLRQALRTEFDRKDRFWNALYPTFELFERHCAGMQARVLTEMEHGGVLPKALTTPSVTSAPPAQREPSEELKRAVHIRDGHRCLCCGATRSLHVDHIAPSYVGGSNQLGNLQTLCKTCNQHKNIAEVNFTRHSTPLIAKAAFALLPIHRSLDPRNVEHLEQYLRRSFNFFYRCSAVQVVQIRLRGQGAGEWSVWLNPGLDPKWLTADSRKLLREAIESRRANERLFGPTLLHVDSGGE